MNGLKSEARKKDAERIIVLGNGTSACEGNGEERKKERTKERMKGRKEAHQSRERERKRERERERKRESGKEILVDRVGT